MPCFASPAARLRERGSRKTRKKTIISRRWVADYSQRIVVSRRHGEFKSPRNSSEGRKSWREKSTPILHFSGVCDMTCRSVCIGLSWTYSRWIHSSPGRWTCCDLRDIMDRPRSHSPGRKGSQSPGRGSRSPGRTIATPDRFIPTRMNQDTINVSHAKIVADITEKNEESVSPTTKASREQMAANLVAAEPGLKMDGKIILHYEDKPASKQGREFLHFGSQWNPCSYWIPHSSTSKKKKSSSNIGQCLVVTVALSPCQRTLPILDSPKRIKQENNDDLEVIYWFSVELCAAQML